MQHRAIKYAFSLIRFSAENDSPSKDTENRINNSEPRRVEASALSRPKRPLSSRDFQSDVKIDSVSQGEIQIEDSSDPPLSPSTSKLQCTESPRKICDELKIIFSQRPRALYQFTDTRVIRIDESPDSQIDEGILAERNRFQDSHCKSGRWNTSIAQVTSRYGLAFLVTVSFLMVS